LIGIVIVAHGGLAQEYRAAMEHVVGPLPKVESIRISAECDREKKQQEICSAAESVDSGSGVVIVTDLFGGSPSNLSLRACWPPDRRILYGANLPMLIKLAKTRNLPLTECVHRALDAGRKYINCQNITPDGA